MRAHPQALSAWERRQPQPERRSRGAQASIETRATEHQLVGWVEPVVWAPRRARTGDPPFLLASPYRLAPALEGAGQGGRSHHRIRVFRTLHRSSADPVPPLQKTRSGLRSLGRLTDRWRTRNCCPKARFPSAKAARLATNASRNAKTTWIMPIASVGLL